MSRNLAITSTDGHTGHLIAELILTDEDFKGKVASITCISLNPTAARNVALEELGAVIVPHIPGKLDDMVAALKKAKIDTICVIPPAVDDKLQITTEIIEAAKMGDIPNSLLISSAGADLAEREKQPRLREFIDIEAMFMAPKGDKETKLGQSPCVIRAGFYAEAILLYNEQAKTTGKLPLPLGQGNKFAPVALGDVAQVAAHVLTGEGPHGFKDEHRGQLMVVTGPLLMAGDDLANEASKSLGMELKYEDISEKEAKKLLDVQGDLAESEKEYLLEYYSLVREGKTNYVSTTAFKMVTGELPAEPSEFFTLYEGEFKVSNKRRRVTRSMK